MIASLRGKIGGRDGNSVIVDVSGVGYAVQVSSRTLEALGGAGEEVFLVIETQVREDAISLIGFLDDDERNVFRILTSVQGVGTRLGLALFSAMSVRELVACLAAGDRDALVRADGVGPKLAARLVTELQEKATAAARALGVAPDAIAAAPARQTTVNADTARAALRSLGYSRTEAEALLVRAMQDWTLPDDPRAIITACLRLAGQNG